MAKIQNTLSTTYVAIKPLIGLRLKIFPAKGTNLEIGEGCLA